MEGDYNSRLNKMQKEEYLIKNACYSVTKYYLCKRNNKRSLLGRKQRSQVARSFPNRYQFSCTNKVTSLFSISCILRIILERKRCLVAIQTVLGWTARGRWLEYGQASAGKRAAFPEDRKQRRQREAGRKKGNGKGEDGKEAQGTPGGREADSGEREGGFREGKRESPVKE